MAKPAKFETVATTLPIFNIYQEHVIIDIETIWLGRTERPKDCADLAHKQTRIERHQKDGVPIERECLVVN